MVISEDELLAFVKAKHACPHDRLGMHHYNANNKAQLVVRAYLPNADRCEIIDPQSNQIFKTEKLHQSGFFEALINRKSLFKYLLRISHYDGSVS